MARRVREPAVAGMFYEAKPESLRKQIEWCFRHRLGPGEVPQGSPGSTNTIVSAQVPHAGYAYSGPAAAHIYYALHQDTKPDTVIILGPNHTGLGLPVSVYPEGVWKTPLGLVEIDKEIVDALVKTGVVDKDELAHIQEHSIEVQLPFLQYIYGDTFKFVPIVMMDQSLETARKLSDAIVKVMKESSKRIIVLASSDMTHYESHDTAYAKDKKALSYIENLDVEGLYSYAESVDLTMCGIGPVAVAMLVAKAFGARGLVLKYYTSGDIVGDKSFVVGYASVIFARSVLIKKREAEAEEIVERGPVVFAASL